MRCLLILFALLAAPAAAGTRATYAGSDGKVIIVEVADGGDARVGGLGAADYGVLSGGAFYVVGTSDGRTRVARIEDVAAAIEQVLPAAVRGLLGGAAVTRGLTIAADGAETVGGRAGTRYRVTDANGEAQALVVSGDAALRPVGAALEGFTVATILPMAALLGPLAAEMVRDVKVLFALGTPLALPNGLRLTKVERADVPEDRVRLPAAPASVDALVAEMRAAASGGKD